jgi:hypothetical protein
MAPADDVDGPAKASPLWAKYGTRIDSQSARELLAARMEPPPAPEPVPVPAPEPAPAPKAPAPRGRKRTPGTDAMEGGLDQIGDFLRSRQGQSLSKEIVRGVFGLLRKRR